jgi:hypothetical protein
MSQKAEAEIHDLREGLRGSLVVHEPNLAGAAPQHRLSNPDLVSPGVTHPAGQTTHG